MVRLTAPLSRNSVGLVRPTHGSCGLLKTEQTAGLNEWPPDRRDIDKNASPHPQSLLQQAISAVTLTTTPERQRYLNQTAPPEQSQTHHRTHHESDESQRDMIQKPTETLTAEARDTLTDPQTNERKCPHDISQTNRCHNKPLSAPLPQNERTRAPEDPPLEATINQTKKAPPPLQMLHPPSDRTKDAAPRMRS